MIDFSTLRRPATPNTVLYADDGDTPGPADLPALRLQAPPDAVIAAWDRVVREAPRTEVVSSAPQEGRHHAIQRSRILRFPDDIHARAVPDGAGGTRLLLYGASRYGRSDLGVNRSRLADWTARLAARLAR